MNSIDYSNLAQAAYSDLLPPWTYQSDEFLRLEIEHLFKPNWLLAGHISDFTNTGDFVTFDAFDEQVVIVRDAQGQLNAFHNICRHRGGRIVADQKGNCRQAMVCPYHGWSYALDGKLLGVPAIETFESSALENVALAQVELESWMGFVFIRFRAGGESLQQQLGAMDHEVAPYIPQSLESFQPTTEALKPYNWKCIHDNDNEGYHVPVGHPALHQLYGHDYADSEENGFMVSRGTVSDKPARAWSVRHYQKLLPHFDHLPEERQKLWFYFQVFPNLVFAFYPDMMEIYMTLPVSTDCTRLVSRTFALPDSRREVRASRYLNVRINNETSEEDEKFVGWLQQGMKSSAWEEPRLSALESGVRQFHHQIQQYLPVGA